MASLKRKPVPEAAPAPVAAEKTKRVPKPPAVGKRAAGANTVIIKTDMIALEHLRVYHKNPRVGNVDEIAKSLHANGQFKPIVVNIGTKTGRKYEILAGNHTYLGAKKTLDWQESGRHMHKDPWEKLYAAFVDVTDAEAAKIVLADNRTAEYGSYEDSLLAQLFAELPDTVGTGYHKDEIDKIISSLPQPEDTSVAIKTLEDLKANMPALIGPESDNRVGNGKWDDNNGEDYDDFPVTTSNANGEPDEGEDEDIDEETAMEIDDVSVQLQATLQFLEGNIPLGENAWGVPELREDMLLTKDDIKGLRTWSDRETTPDDGKGMWFANYGSGARKGLPFDRTVMGFYSEDDKFDPWFLEPSWNVTKFTLLGLNRAVIPDYSLYGNAPRAVHMYQVFKAMWLGRYMQEAGWRVAPRLQFCPTDPDTMEIALLGHPEGMPVLFTGAQTFARMTNAATPEEEAKLWQKGVSKAVQQLDPEVLVAYVGPPGKRYMEGINFGNWKGEVRYIESVSTIRNRKRDGIVKATKARKDRLKAAKEKLKAEAVASKDAQSDQRDDSDE